jgi:hypothetical protein
MKLFEVTNVVKGICAGLLVEDDEIIHTAPILRWTIKNQQGWKWNKHWLERHHYIVEEVGDAGS